MKKLAVTLFALILAGACTPTNNSNAPATNTNATATTSPAATTDDAIVREQDAWGALEKKDIAAFGDMLATDYLEVGDQNVFDKAGVVAYVKDLSIDNAIFSDWKVVPVGSDVVILNYNVVVKGSYKGKEFPEGPYHASAAWANRGGKWLAVYYQETLAGSAQPNTQPASTAAKPAATPATKSAQTTVPTDPVAREKMAWDLIKQKNMDAFGAMLDDALFSVESDGVLDKAGTLKSVASMQPGNFDLTDFKTATISPDATLVTYVFKAADPKAPKERHTTIWVKRGDAWKALFHQATPEGSESAAASATSPKTTASPSAKPPTKG